MRAWSRSNASLSAATTTLVRRASICPERPDGAVVARLDSGGGGSPLRRFAASRITMTVSSALKNTAKFIVLCTGQAGDTCSSKGVPRRRAQPRIAETPLRVGQRLSRLLGWHEHSPWILAQTDRRGHRFATPLE